MFTLKLKNEYNNIIDLTVNEDKYQVTNVVGLNPPQAVISTSNNANLDGVVYNSSRLDKRNIVITVVIQDEQNRISLNRVVQTKKYIRVYYNNLYIDGYVESFEYDIFTEKCIAQISIICTNPYFINVNENTYTISAIDSVFKFPFSTSTSGILISDITYKYTSDLFVNGNYDSYCKIELTARNTVVNPIIKNVTTNQIMIINTTITTDDTIVISTQKGNKYIHKHNNNTITNIIGSLDYLSKFITLVPATNTIETGAESGSEYLDAKIIYHDCYIAI